VVFAPLYPPYKKLDYPPPDNGSADEHVGRRINLRKYSLLDKKDTQADQSAHNEKKGGHPRGNAIKPVPTLGGIKQLYTIKDLVVSVISLRGFRPVGNFQSRVSGNPRSEMTETTLQTTRAERNPPFS
jgi:hypothetical protein